MECPKCKSELVMDTKNVIEAGMQLLSFFRCEKCWETYNVYYSNPYIGDCNEAPLRLTGCNSPSGYRHAYWKCSREGADSYILIANRGKFAKRKYIELLGLTIVAEPNEHSELDGWRLYEIV